MVPSACSQWMSCEYAKVGALASSSYVILPEANLQGSGGSSRVRPTLITAWKLGTEGPKRGLSCCTYLRMFSPTAPSESTNTGAPESPESFTMARATPYRGLPGAGRYKLGSRKTFPECVGKARRAGIPCLLLRHSPLLPSSSSQQRFHVRRTSPILTQSLFLDHSLCSVWTLLAAAAAFSLLFYW